MPHTLEWFDHADPPKRGAFEHPGYDLLDPHILAKFAETVLQQAGVSYEPPIRVIYTTVDHQTTTALPHETLFWSALQPPSGHTDDSSV